MKNLESNGVEDAAEAVVCFLRFPLLDDEDKEEEEEEAFRLDPWLPELVVATAAFACCCCWRANCCS